MRLSLVPKEQDYFRLFSDLAANLDEAAQLLVRFMEHYDDAKSIGAAILEREHVGDKILHDIVKRLNKSFITPIDREDIYDLVATMDEVLDNIEAATDAMVLYRVAAPTEFARRQAKVIAEAAAVLHQIIDDLEKRTDLMERVISVNSLENEGDRIVRDAIAALVRRRHRGAVRSSSGRTSTSSSSRRSTSASTSPTSSRASCSSTTELTPRWTSSSCC